MGIVTDGIVSPEICMVKFQTTTSTVFGDRDFNEVIKIKLDHKGMGSNQIGSVNL